MMATRTIYPFGPNGSSAGGGAYIVTWDGASVPVVANIPAGVTVTYNSTTYTGTMAAGASTLGNIYLVPNGTSQDMYITATSGGSYVWVKTGSTAISLDGYATEAWVEARDVDLTVAQYEALVNSGTVDPNKRYFVDEEQ